MSQDEDLAARRELEATLDALSREQTNAVARAFSFFSILSNIAEDQHHIRRSRAHALAGSAPREGSLAHALDAAFAAGLQASDLAAFFEEALISPVLTAHPTEVQRKSILNCLMVIARLLDARDRMALTPEEALENEEALRRGVLTLWQTRMLRTFFATPLSLSFSVLPLGRGELVARGVNSLQVAVGEGVPVRRLARSDRSL